MCDAQTLVLPSVSNFGPEDETGSDRGLLRAALMRTLAPAAAGRAADALLDRFATVASVLTAERGFLEDTAGLPRRTIDDLALLRRLCVSLCRIEASRQPVISSWSALLAYVRAAQAQASREQFRTLFLDKRNRLIRDELLAQGTVDHAPVYPREVVREALRLDASAIILVHNHPSGDPTPSAADIEMTRRIVEAARTLDLVVHDHLIVGRDGTASLKSLGLM